MVSLKTMLVVISFAMCIDQIVAGKGRVFFAENEIQDVKKMSPEKYGQLFEGRNFEHQAAEQKENVLGSKIQGGPYGKGWVADVQTRGGYTIRRQGKSDITINNAIDFKRKVCKILFLNNNITYNTDFLSSTFCLDWQKPEPREEVSMRL